MNKRLLFLLAASCLLYFSNLNGVSIYILDEAKNASCAMEMAARNDWIVPTFNGELRTDKPPLHYYFMRLAYFVSGSVTPGAARFFSALCGVLLIIGVFRVTSKILSEKIAFWTALILLASVQLTIQFHLAVPDPYLILSLTATLYCCFLGLQGNRRAMLGAYACAGLAFLCKGLIAVVIPGLVVLTYCLVTEGLRWRSLRKLDLPLGAALFLAVAAPWYILVGLATNGAWLHGFFIEHNVSRYTSTMEGHAGFPLAPFVIMIAALLPFSLVVIPAFTHALRSKREHPLLLFSAVVVVVVGIFFSISRTILPSYPAPALPFLAVVLGAYLTRLIDNAVLPGKLVHATFAFASIISLAVPFGIFIAVRQESQLSTLSELPWFFVFLPVATIIAWITFFSNRKFSFYTLAAAWISVSLVFLWVGYPLVDDLNPVSRAMSMRRLQYDNLPLVGYKRINPAFVFQAGHPIDMVTNDEELEKWLQRHGKSLIISRRDIVQGSSALGALTEVFSGKDLFEKTETVVLVSGGDSTP